MVNRTAIGVFPSYRAATDAVRELELLGISGEQVEVVTDAAYDVRGQDFVPLLRHESNVASKHDARTLVVVRPADDRGLKQARDILHNYGAKELHSRVAHAGAPIEGGGVGTTEDTSIGGPGTAGNDPMDNEGRGKEMKRVTESSSPTGEQRH